MLLQPKKTKFQKYRKGQRLKKCTKGYHLVFGDIGLKALESGKLTARQIESVRQTIKKKVKKSGKIWIRIYPDIPVTQKPAEVRMGKGKGAVHHWASPVKKGRILFELVCTSPDLAREALLKASDKLPIKTKLVTYNQNQL
uniref:ribosomal protein L16 n=1 Tax=Meteora sporadica TaxID=2913902 RepID=UPI00300144BE|nr:ribosomal protein L16 [Meteora sporadica]WVH37089.1 ribosomal protein L16 [Meteora sporadica]